ncbi:hypothetical protein BOTBODRAFT_177975 [Botryobasidium botryosum FD-172 SS1]|uniref:26S proteasome regulatory subunit RPN2 n=1 Tax=Botryobasidium botryosum (strain FD-172 SS1) TaxID=930990 RepID=A0A067M7K4_BOTB1|nr:hypothetical protein BOTBODRAFT_177975 [Botryobasidium botryosum FD-172 SS1]
MVPRPQTSAAGVLALLSEPEPLVKQHALRSLNNLVPQFWAEISEHIEVIEDLYEGEALPKDARDMAALITSKVYYYLAEYDEALHFALGAGHAFEAEHSVPGSEEFVETVVSKAIDRYIQLRAAEEAGERIEEIDERLLDIIEGIFKRCIDDGEYRQALGIALESSRLDIITNIYKQTKDITLLSYVIEALLDSSFSLHYRIKVLHHILPLFPPLTANSSHVNAITRVHVTLSQKSLTVDLLTSLVAAGEKEKNLLAYQFAFDLLEGGTQDYLEEVRSGLPEGAEGFEKQAYDNLRKILSGEESIRLYLDFLQRNNHVDLLILKETKESLDPRSSIYHTALTLQNAYMHSGTNSDAFLRNNLDWLGRASNWSKFSATAALGVIHKGNVGESMRLLGPYLPADGAAGANAGPGSSPFSEGGALYALGLVNAGRGKDVLGFLQNKLGSVQEEVVQHGAALGLGVAGMGTGNLEAFNNLKTILFMDSAIAGEAAGYAMGLVMLGTGHGESIEEMLSYSHETQHEKIIRGLAIGVALIYYGRQEEADPTVERLLAEKDPILRYGGVYTLALAYAGTSNNHAVKKLLHIAVSDTSDDVRRAAVTSLAFLLFKNPGQVPRLVQLLSESYNPHVRCGATLALGISCAGTGSQDAIDILEPMTKDPVDFVRQGAFISLAMILVQQTEASSPSLASTRALFSKVITDKHEDPMARFGASIAQGLIDAGGRNVTITLQSRAGANNMGAIVGMTMFCQFWYWYPLAHCACLAFEPTGIIGLTDELRAPVFEVISNAKPSLFAYPAPAKPPTKETVEKVATAVLSTTAKAKAREKTKEKEKAASEGHAMDTDEKPEVKQEIKDVEMKDDAEVKAEGTSSTKPGEGLSSSSSSSKRERRAPEPTFEKLANCSRVTPAQLSHIVFPSDCRFQPVRPVSTVPTAKLSLTARKTEKYLSGGGIIMLLDQKPGESIEWVAPFGAQEGGDADAGASAAPAAEGADATRGTDGAQEANPPPPFEYPFGNDA